MIKPLQNELKEIQSLGDTPKTLLLLPEEFKWLGDIKDSIKDTLVGINLQILSNSLPKAPDHLNYDETSQRYISELTKRYYEPVLGKLRKHCKTYL